MRTVSSKSHVWEIKIEVEDILRLKSEGVMDLTDLDDKKLNDEFNKINSLFAFGAILSTICSRQIMEREMSYDEFFADFTAEQITEAREKIMEVVVDFFRRAGGDQEAILLQKGMQTYLQAREALYEKVMEMDIMPIVMENMDQQIQEALS